MCRLSATEGDAAELLIIFFGENTHNLESLAPVDIVVCVESRLHSGRATVKDRKLPRGERQSSGRDGEGEKFHQCQKVKEEKHPETFLFCSPNNILNSPHSMLPPYLQLTARESVKSTEENTCETQTCPARYQARPQPSPNLHPPLSILLTH